MAEKSYKLFSDGACRGNPGIAAREPSSPMMLIK